ncbi:MAG: hypothetical protein PHF18_07455 [Methanosarcina sp.]|nr:hypothetical protein [Methanosarcina sp.]MDD3246670.1 hypothetical protein [Methanosarcina sp.]MDD4248105.1 hypothetical protein [Methanosarcina sp.]
MQNLNLKLELTTKSLTSLREILSEPYSPIICEPLCSDSSAASKSSGSS